MEQSRHLTFSTAHERGTHGAKNGVRTGTATEKRTCRRAAHLHPNPADNFYGLPCTLGRPSLKEPRSFRIPGHAIWLGAPTRLCPRRLRCAVADRDGAAVPLGRGTKTIGGRSAAWFGGTHRPTTLATAWTREANCRPSRAIRSSICLPDVRDASLASRTNSRFMAASFTQRGTAAPSSFDTCGTRHPASCRFRTRARQASAWPHP